MAALLHAMVCHSVTTVHSCCVPCLAQLSVVCGRLAGCCSAAQPHSVFPFKLGGFHSIWRRCWPGDTGREEFPLKNIITSSPIIFG